MKEIRVHGRGGQGGMAGARILATAFVQEGKWASSFPEFGFERRGAPVRAFIRVDDRPIREKMKVYYPDCLLVIDPMLINSKATFEGFKPGGILVLNGCDPALPNPPQFLPLYLSRSDSVRGLSRSDSVRGLSRSDSVRGKGGEGGFSDEMTLKAIGYVNATKIGLEEIGMAATNTCMLGAFARTTGWISLNSILSSLAEYFSGGLLDKNIRCVERGFNETTVILP